MTARPPPLTGRARPSNGRGAPGHTGLAVFGVVVLGVIPGGGGCVRGVIEGQGSHIRYWPFSFWCGSCKREATMKRRTRRVAWGLAAYAEAAGCTAKLSARSPSPQAPSLSSSPPSLPRQARYHHFSPSDCCRGISPLGTGDNQGSIYRYFIYFRIRRLLVLYVFSRTLGLRNEIEYIPRLPATARLYCI